MDKRQAKRKVCEEVASDLVMRLEDGRIGAGLDGEDRRRYEECAAELAEEMLRRAGVWREARAHDPRQITIYDFLGDRA